MLVSASETVLEAARSNSNPSLLRDPMQFSDAELFGMPSGVSVKDLLYLFCSL
jgi:hypothetical protein